MFRSVLVVGLFLAAGTNGYAQTTAEIDRIPARGAAASP